MIIPPQLNSTKKIRLAHKRLDDVIEQLDEKQPKYNTITLKALQVLLRELEGYTMNSRG